jgi:hypothetical protein
VYELFLCGSTYRSLTGCWESGYGASGIVRVTIRRAERLVKDCPIEGAVCTISGEPKSRSRPLTLGGGGGDEVTTSLR